MARASTISEHDLRRVLDIVHPEVTSAPAPELPKHVMHGLADLIPCSAVTFVALDPYRWELVAGQQLDLAEPPDVDQDEADALFFAAYWDCQSCCQPELMRGPGVASTWQDYYTRREFRRLTMAAYYDLVGAGHELLVCLPSQHGLTRRVILWRDPADPPFTERERLLLTLLRPHLAEMRDRVEAQHRNLPALTPRQLQLLQRLARGDTNRRLARDLGLSEGTVRKHLENIYSRLGVNSRTEAVAQASPLLTT